MKRLHSDDQESSSSAQTVASIDDLLIEIFSHLRLNPLIRFKSVSKRWNSIISNLKRDPEPAVGLILYATNSDRLFAYFYPFYKSDRPSFLLDHTNKNVEIKILHGCNGLLLYSAMENKNTNTQYFVVNPTTIKRRTMLPEPMHPERILAMCLAFNPSKTPHYKVVCVSGRKLQDHEEYQYDRFQVYSSETGSWRYARVEAFKGYLDVENGVYWNGALHWISNSSDTNSIYFDPDNEDHQMPQVFPTPPTLMHRTNHEYNKYFGESCGHLHFVGQAMTGELILYEMKTDYSEWFVKYRLHHSMRGLIQGTLNCSMRGRIQGTLNCWGTHRICALFWREKDEDCFLVLWNKRRIIRYNIVSGVVEIFRSFPHSFISAPSPYFESICSV